MRGLGLICVDEEHDASYKQESDPRYDARTVAAKRAALEGAVAVYGSATPRPESWERLERLELGGRLAGALPPVHIVDLRREARLPALGAAARELGKLARERRQGDPAAQPARRRAGDPLPRLRRHAPLPELRRRARPPRATACCAATTAATPSRRPSSARTAARPSSPASAPARSGSSASSPRGCPELELIRLDADTTRSRSTSPRRCERFAATDRAVLLGTQMVAKGHHFEGVALAAVVDADTGMALPDFRAEERTFQLLTQLAGRSGRDAPGRVLIQTFQPDARAVELAARHDVERLPRRRARAAPRARLPAVPPPRADRRLRPGAGSADAGARRS